MAQVDKIKVGSTTYDIANATSATLAFTSSDVADGSASAWTSVAKLTSGETYASMFAKISQMFKNIRYVYAQLGTKAASSHNHAAGNITSGTIAAARLPLSSSQTNSTSYAPTSSLVYSMNTTLSSLNSTSSNHETRITALENAGGGSVTVLTKNLYFSMGVANTGLSKSDYNLISVHSTLFTQYSGGTRFCYVGSTYDYTNWTAVFCYVSSSYGEIEILTDTGTYSVTLTYTTK